MNVAEAPIAVAGVGAMGQPMLAQLHRKGFNVRGFDIRPLASFGSFAGRMVENPGDLFPDSRILISVVRDLSQNEALCLKHQAVFREKPYPEILVVCSTLSPSQFHRLAQKLPEDVTVVDAPMSGAPIAAEKGELTFMVGAHGKHLELLRPLLLAMGERVEHAGLPGAGMAFKVLNNYVAAASVVHVRRILEAARQLGVDDGRLLDVMSASSGATWFGDGFDRISWSCEGYDRENTIGILEKDVACALDVIQDNGLETSPLDEGLLTALRNLRPYKR